MIVDDQIRDKKNYNMILIEKQLKYQPHHQAKLINMNITLVKKYYYPINNKYLNKLNLRIVPYKNF